MLTSDFRRTRPCSSKTFNENWGHDRLRRSEFTYRMAPAMTFRHPELMLLGRRSMVLGIPRRPEETFYQTLVDIDFLHIVRMEPIEAATPRGGNGDA